MISPTLTRRRQPPVVVRRDAVAGRGRSRRAKRRGLFSGTPSRLSAIATLVLVAAVGAWLLTFTYIATLMH